MPWKDRIYSLVLAAGFLAGAANAQQLQVQNQIETPDRKYLFREESSEQEKVQKKRFESSVAIDPARSTDTNFNAPHVEFDKEKNEVKGSGGVLVSADGIQAQADQGRLNLETKDSSLSGNVVVSDPKGSIVSDQAELNVDAYTGTFSGASFTIEEGGYNVRSQTAEKLSETKYHLLDSSLTTCACQDGEVPWSIDSGECNITQEGYAHCYDTTLDFAGVPFIYTPYLGFPVKTERTSGLLVPQIGSSSRNGFQARIPVFVVIDESTDMTVAPFIETKSRIGSGFDFRKTFSRQSGLESRLIYSDERARDGHGAQEVGGAAHLGRAAQGGRGGCRGLFRRGRGRRLHRGCRGRGGSAQPVPREHPEGARRDDGEDAAAAQAWSSRIMRAPFSAIM
ncbi:MAG: hypothetical protein DCC75_08030 [Proteobacteria bacterium]|nr:MAG: hypothetical protein DCC75_08030 [Pseudomonadota bacterium]